MSEVIVVTDRLVVRAWRPDEAAVLLDLVNDPAFDEFALDSWKLPSLDAAEALIARHRAMHEQHWLGAWPIFVRSRARPVGICGVKPCLWKGKPRLELLYRLRGDARGHGYATEAAAAVVASRVDFESAVAIIDVANARSRRVAERLGMKRVDRDVYRGVKVQLFARPPG